MMEVPLTLDKKRFLWGELEDALGVICVFVHLSPLLDLLTVAIQDSNPYSPEGVLG